MIEPAYLSVSAIAKRLSDSEKHIRREIKRGALIAHKFRRSIRISVTDLETYERLCRAPISPAKADR